jgi:hypothetical protein
MRIRSRIERLEDDMLPLPLAPPEFIQVHSVDSQKKVVNTMVIQLGQIRPQGRGWRAARRSSRVKGD